MANQYSELVSRLDSELTAYFSPAYTNIVVETRFFDAGKLPTFEKYCIIISPPQNDAWQEQVISVRTIQYLFGVDIYLLVKNFHDVNSLFGQTSPDFGLFQMISDVKDSLRSNNLNGFLDKTYSEPAGPLAIEYAASAGFDTGEHALIRRARLRFTCRTPGACAAIAT